MAEPTGSPTSGWPSPSGQRERRVATLAPWVDGSATVLEVGCGAGAFLAQAAEREWSAGRRRARTQQAEHCRRRGLDVEQAGFQDVELAADVVAAFHVFEHLKDPRAFLRAVKADLLYLEAPDLAHAPSSLSDFFQAPLHYSFTALTLTNMLGVEGFEPVFVSERGQNLSMIARPGATRPVVAYDVGRVAWPAEGAEWLQRLARMLPACSVVGKVRGVIESV